MENLETDLYKEAEKKVKRIRNFYLFLGFFCLYIAVNLFIFFLNYRELKPNETIWRLKYFLLPVLWGIGLTFYGLKTFFPGFIFGSHWEERKIKELMEKERSH